ncbi:helix-turn-helix domain-containing protein [Enterococcus sp. DIV0756]|uniref:helix-turn-helix domain-containing protein n=1 Tax=Enterococcus sp. DIV0756 TaxID=2774636 RepID=UPI003F6856E9
MRTLINLAKSGNEQAMIILIKQFEPLLIKLATKYSNRIDEDCYQELSVKFIIAVSKFDLNKFEKK